MITPLYEVHDLLQRNRILISFSGKLTQSLIEAYGDAVKGYLEQAERPSGEIRDIFSIFIEQTQNIKNYCVRRADDPWADAITSSCIVTIGQTEDGSCISSGNLLHNGDVAALTERLAALAQLDKAQLKQLYKAKLREAAPSESDGAGIGLIEMSRKARLPLEYSIKPINDHLSFFTLKAVI